MTEDARPLVASIGRLTAEEVRARSFATARRGYDPAEVRALQEQVARELQAAAAREAELQRALAEAERRAANPVVDEETLTAALGREAARLLQAARESAAEILRAAEEKAAELRQQAEEAAASSAAQAAADAEALLARTRTECRAMVQEAQELRNRVLADLQRRREEARRELEHLREGRRSVARAVQAARQAADEVLRELAGPRTEVEPEEPAAPDPLLEEPAEEGMRGPVQPGPVQAGPVQPGPVQAGAPAEAPTGAVGSGVRPALPPTPEKAPETAPSPEAPTPEEGEPPVAPVDASAGQREPRPLEETGPEERASREAGLPATGGSSTGGPEARPRAARPEVDALFARLRAGRQRRAPGSTAGRGSGMTAGDSSRAARTEGGGPEGGGDESGGLGDTEPAVRLLRNGAVPRPRRVLGEAPAPDPAEPEDSPVVQREEPVVIAAYPEAGPEEGSVADRVAEPEGPAPEDLALLGQRDDLLRPLEAALARRLKRCLQDDQNDVLDRLRSATVRAGRSEERPAVLPSLEAHVARYAEACRGPLREAALAGLAFARAAQGEQGTAPGEGTSSPDAEMLAGEAATELAGVLVASLRRRLLDETEQDEQLGVGEDLGAAQGLAERIGAAFREWKGRRVEALAVDHLVAVFAAAQLGASGAGKLRWVVDDDGGPCADCDDNALAGPVPAGAPYPTGHVRPPAHPGCRCLLVPASP